MFGDSREQLRVSHGLILAETAVQSPSELLRTTVLEQLYSICIKDNCEHPIEMHSPLILLCRQGYHQQRIGRLQQWVNAFSSTKLTAMQRIGHLNQPERYSQIPRI